MSEPESIALFVESYTTAALDGARISVGTALLLTDLDKTLPPEIKEEVMDAMEEAATWLNHARALMQTKSTTSVHLVNAETSRIILPK